MKFRLENCVKISFFKKSRILRKTYIGNTFGQDIAEVDPRITYVYLVIGQSYDMQRENEK
jgi:hypothetical protein